jgi:hypothetical protein
MTASHEEQTAREALRAHLEVVLLEHLLTHTRDTGSDERFPLVDKLCAPGDETLQTGREEIALLAEALVDALPAGAAQAIEAGNLRAVMEAHAWRNAMTGLCTIWPKTADEAAAHLRARLHPPRGPAIVAPVSPPVPVPDDADMLHWLEQHATVNFDFETASIRFTVPDSLRGGHSLREILAAAQAHEASRA